MTVNRAASPGRRRGEILPAHPGGQRRRALVVPCHTMSSKPAAGGREFARGIARACAGALVFSIPLLMTMEMWWLGFHIPPWRLVLMLAAFLPLLAGLSHFIGFDETGGPGHALLHAVVAYGVGFLTAAGMLGLFAVLGPGMAFTELVGKVALQSVPGALGALLAQSHFGTPTAKEQRQREASYAGHLLFMIVGALYLAMTVAPTEEMSLIGYSMTDLHALFAMALSVLVLHSFVYGVGFRAHPAAESRKVLGSLMRLSVVGYALSLLVSAYLLWTFGRFEGDHIVPMVHSTVVLGVPASLGAAAARLTLDVE